MTPEAKEEAIEQAVDEIDKVYTTGPLDFKKIGDIIIKVRDHATAKLREDFAAIDELYGKQLEENAKLRKCSDEPNYLYGTDEPISYNEQGQMDSSIKGAGQGAESAKAAGLAKEKRNSVEQTKQMKGTK